MSLLSRAMQVLLGTKLLIITSTGWCIEPFVPVYSVDLGSHRVCDGTCFINNHHRLFESQFIYSEPGRPAETNDEHEVINPSDVRAALRLGVRSSDGMAVFSSAVPRFTKVEYGPLTLELSIPANLEPSNTRLLVDGQAAHPELTNGGSEWMRNEAGWLRSFQWECPPLGRHTLQFETRLGNAFVVSEVLLIEIVPPAKPEIVAVGSLETNLQPLKSGQVAELHQDCLVVKFSMPTTQCMLMHTSGLDSIRGTSLGNCCFEFDLSGQLSVGRHALKFCRASGSLCSMTSELSDSLWVQYEPRDALASIRNENALRRLELVYQVRSLARDEFLSESTNNLKSQLRSTIRKSHIIAGISPQPSAVPDLMPVENEESTEPVAAPPAPMRNAPALGELPSPPLPHSNKPHQVPSPANVAKIVQLWIDEVEAAANLATLSQQRAQELNKLEDDLASAESNWQANKVVSHVIFDTPAFFAKHRYGSEAQENAAVGLVLLEGMELRTYATGHWELTIPYIRPITPSELHLQIQFKTSEGRWKPLTLQPICFDAGEPCVKCKHSCAEATCDCHGNTQPVIKLTGYSPILSREVGYFTEVRRRGTAQFGHGYDELLDRRGL